MRASASAVLGTVLAFTLTSCGKQFDITLPALAFTTREHSDYQPPGFTCSDTQGTGGPIIGLEPGQIAFGSESWTGSGCLFGNSATETFDRGAVRFDLTQIPAGAAFTTIDLIFDHGGGSEGSTAPNCKASIGLATVDWTTFSNDTSPSAFTFMALPELSWTITQTPQSVDPKGPNVRFGPIEKPRFAFQYQVDLKPAFNFWFSANPQFKKPNFGLIFSTPNEPFPQGSNASCFERVGNFSLHVVGST